MSDISFTAAGIRPEALAELEQWLNTWGARHDLETELVIDTTRDPLRRVQRTATPESQIATGALVAAAKAALDTATHSLRVASTVASEQAGTVAKPAKVNGIDLYWATSNLVTAIRDVQHSVSLLAAHLEQGGAA